jgi:PIN domain nuclease of toxin-antitoxin system
LRLLADTQLLLQAAMSASGPASKRAVALMGDPANQLHFSAASIWEVAIKFALGRPAFQTDPHLLRRALIDNGYIEVPITAEHGAVVAGLPPLHKDPFDRILITQAMIDGLLLLTTDGILARYPGPVMAV